MTAPPGSDYVQLVGLKNTINRAIGQAFPDNLLEASRKEAIAILQRNGFATETPPLDALQSYQPWLFRPAERALFRAQNMVRGASVELYRYEVKMVGTDDSDELGRVKHELIAIVQHPLIVGGARISPEMVEWNAELRAIRNFSWLPPFTPLRGVVWAVEQVVRRWSPDRTLGHPEFDRLYVVYADSDEAASRAITPALREMMLRMRFNGSIELRDGLMLVTAHEGDLSILGLSRLVEPLPWLISAVLPQPQAFR